MSVATPNALEQFKWTPQPAAEDLVRRIVDAVLASCPLAKQLSEKMLDQGGVRFGDCLDHLIAREQSFTAADLSDAGFVASPSLGGCFEHPGAIFPPIVLTQSKNHAALKVESVADFAAAGAAGIPLRQIVGSPGDAVRIGIVSDHLSVIERHGYRGAAGGNRCDDRTARLAQRHLESFRTRNRNFVDDIDGFSAAEKLVDATVADLGVNRTCDLFFFAEREYWQRRNDAAQFQKSRQDRLGLGWANHDHHTYRSSRAQFARLIGFFEKLGLHCRERFYAGADAGWGAQVMEQPIAGVIVFADVDLSPRELFEDFAHEPLPNRAQLGTVGLWCGLHGEAFLQAGMHHLECQFDFDVLRNQMEQTGGIKVMKPFTDFPHLRQAFTEGQRWPVAESRIAKLLDARQITPQQAEQFRVNGAIGSHLENLERNDGFKGFNQKGVSEIIAKTDPRLHLSGS